MSAWLDELRAYQGADVTEEERTRQEEAGRASADENAARMRWLVQRQAAHQAILNSLRDTQIEPLLLDLAGAVAAERYADSALLREIEYAEFPERAVTRREILWAKRNEEHAQPLTPPVSLASEPTHTRCLNSIKWILLMDQIAGQEHLAVQVLLNETGLSFSDPVGASVGDTPLSPEDVKKALAHAYRSPSNWHTPNQGDWYVEYSEPPPTAVRRRQRLHRPWYKKLGRTIIWNRQVLIVCLIVLILSVVIPVLIGPYDPTRFLFP